MERTKVNMGYARCVWAMGSRRKTAVISPGNARLPWFGWMPMWCGIVWYDVVWHGVDGWPPATHHPSHHQLCSMHPPPQPRRGSTFKASKCICDKRPNHHQSPWNLFQSMSIKGNATCGVGGARGVTFNATEIAYMVVWWQRSLHLLIAFQPAIL